VPKREILPDPKYGSSDVAKFVNVLMTAGKKSVAERILYGAFESISKKGGKDPLEVFNQALSNSRPTVEVKSRRVGGANFQVPSKCVRCAGWRSRCAGCAKPRASAARSRWASGSRRSFSKPRKAAAAP
jgi:ribosomal protein S7